jgi:hypothetical protein
MRMRLVAVLFTTLSLTLGALAAGPWLGSAVAQEAAPDPPPAPQVESPGSPPGPNAIWIPGHWQWQDARYQWVPGRWEIPPSGASYVPGRHKRTSAGWVWEPGRWRKP